MLHLMHKDHFLRLNLYFECEFLVCMEYSIHKNVKYGQKKTGNISQPNKTFHNKFNRKPRETLGIFYS